MSGVLYLNRSYLIYMLKMCFYLIYVVKLIPVDFVTDTN